MAQGISNDEYSEELSEALHLKGPHRPAERACVGEWKLIVSVGSHGWASYSLLRSPYGARPNARGIVRQVDLNEREVCLDDPKALLVALLEGLLNEYA